MNWTLHHLLYPLLGVAVLAGGITAVVQHERAKNAEKDVAVQQAKQQAIEGAKAEIEAMRQQQLSALDELAKKPATVQTITKLLPIPLPGHVEVQQVDGKPTLTLSGDPQANLDAIQRNEIQCTQNAINLDACAKTAAKSDEQIKSLQKENKDLQTLVIPRWTLTAAVSKSRDSGYKPAAMVDYRLFKSWGLTVGVVNNSLVGGVSIHFGGTAK